jgi:adenine-specific DNA-methyltransferase
MGERRAKTSVIRDDLDLVASDGSDMPGACTHRKRLGQFHTPVNVARTLVNWVVEDRRARLLDPSCGDGVFLACHRRSVGIEIDGESAAIAKERSPGSLVHEADFFQWAEATQERFHVAAGNPPFIRYQRFCGQTRELALTSCQRLGAVFTNLTSSWAPFLVVTASLLKPNGRMGFVVPAEIGHTTYARPLLEWLCAHFDHVRILAFKEKIFPQLSEDAWLLYCRGFGGSTTCLYLNGFETFRAEMELPRFAQRIELSSWREANSRLRRFLLSPTLLALYEDLVARPGVVRFADVGQASIGYVTGANDFFHLRPSEARRREIPTRVLRTSVRKAEQLPAMSVDDHALHSWFDKDRPVLLLHLKGESRLDEAVIRYLSTPEGERARQTYKCRMREPWYAVPDVKVPDAFISYMSGVKPNLVRNDAGCVCTNSVHAVMLKHGASVVDVQSAWSHPLCELSCELEGHPLGGGLLKLEPGEVAKVFLPMDGIALTRSETALVQNAIEQARCWRHYG